MQEADRNLTEKQTLLDAHQKQIQNIRDEMKHTHRLYVDGQITAQGFGEFYKPAEERLIQLTAELPKLQADVDFLKVNKLSVDDVLHEATSLYDRWPRLPSEDQRKIMECLIEKIEIGEGEIDITFSHLPASEEVCKSQQRPVALLGIAQRRIHVICANISPNRRQRRPFLTVASTIRNHAVVLQA